MSLLSEISDQAMRLGFAAFGAAAIGESETFDYFQKWLAEGKGAEMAYLARHAEARRDPRNLAPGARTVLVVAARYPTNERPGTGFSSLARGVDYHLVARRRLALLADFIASRASLGVARVCVDSAPILEREWAVRAGIGWRGRQGQIVSPTAGCCLALGELLVDVELPPSARLRNQCGDCRKCLEACPTGALQPDGSVDAAKCVSYLTIESKGDFSPEQEKRVGQALFGCDLCAAVCPWNRPGEPAEAEACAAVMDELKGWETPDPEECLAMTEEQFKRRFRESSVRRLGLARLKRNASAAIRNRAKATAD